MGPPDMGPPDMGPPDMGQDIVAHDAAARATAGEHREVDAVLGCQPACQRTCKNAMRRSFCGRLRSVRAVGSGHDGRGGRLRIECPGPDRHGRHGDAVVFTGQGQNTDRRVDGERFSGRMQDAGETPRLVARNLDHCLVCFDFREGFACRYPVALDLQPA